MAAYLPPGWPAGVHPPGTEDFERTAVAWLLEVVPPDYRLHGVLRRHPVALAVIARHHLAACVRGAREGYRTARTELAGFLPPYGIDAVLSAYRDEGRRLVAADRAVDLITRALRGEEFTPRLRAEDQPRAAGPPRAVDPPRAANPRRAADPARAADPPHAASLQPTAGRARAAGRRRATGRPPGPAAP